MSKLRWLLAAALVVAMIPGHAAAQERGSITGQVVEQATGRPVSGAQISVLGTSLGTVTNQEGRFLIPGVPQGTRTLEANFLGYRKATREVVVGASPAVVSFQLEVDVLGLDELVVVGYGTERRRNVAGAISSLSPEAVVAEVPAASVDNILQGRLAGVQVTQNSGNPGAAISVRVRGASSISAGNQPLYVIDGVPLTQGNFSGIDGAFGGQGIDALSDLNPNEIESLEVLKDASAAAIYGSRASNGVVLITTKRGSARDRADVTFNAYTGVQSDWKRVRYLDTDQYMEVYNEGWLNRYGEENFIGYSDDGIDNEVEVEPGANTDWLDQVLRKAPISSVTASITGGSDRVRYFVTGTAFNQQGIVKSFGYERLNGRVNLDYAASDRLTLGTNVSLTRGITFRARSDNTIYGPYANATANPPTDKVYNEDGTYASTLYANPVGLAEENEAEERSVRILGNAYANYSLLEGINLRLGVGLDQLSLRSRMYDSPLIGPAVGTNGEGTAADAFVNKATYEGTLNWLRDFGGAHSFSGVVGTSFEKNIEESASVTGTQFPSNYFRYLTSAASITAGESELEDWSLLSYFSRLSYTYADRYTATFNVRTDGSSRFGEDNRYGVFPSASLLWRVSEEPFLQDSGPFSNLALRLSYGRTGNQFGIGNYAARGLVGGGFNYGDEPGLAPSQLANPGLKWETTDQFNAGTEVSILGDRLSFAVDYYVKTTNELLVARPIPSTTGFTTLWSNIGSMENRGLELATRAQLVNGGSEGLNWSVDLNVSTNRNEVTALYNGEPINAGFASRVEVGHPLGVFYGYKTDGIFRSAEEVAAHPVQSSRTAPGDIRFKDINGRDADGELTGEPDGQINDDDRTIIGSPWPDYVGGLTNTLSFRGLDLSVFLQYSYGNDIYNANRIYTEAYGSYLDNHTTRALDRWTPDNPDATEPRAVWGDPNGNTRDSDRFIEDGSYLRVKNAVLGYSFPGSIASRFGFRGLRMYVQAQNLFTFTEYGGFDPEVNYAGDTAVTRGTDFYTLPQPRTFTAGFNISF